MDDKTLYRRFLQGETAAFEELVLRYRERLIFFLYQYIRDLYQCEDLAQEVFAAVYVFPDRYDLEKGFTTYLYTLARNKAVDYLRKHSRLVFTETVEREGYEEDALLKKVVREETGQQVHAALAQLKENYRLAIYLVDLQGLSYSQAAEIMGMGGAQFKVCLFRARQALKKRLEKEGIGHEER